MASFSRCLIASFFPLLSHAQSISLMCQDPRLVAGGNAMGGYVTPNVATESVSFTASSDQYKYGETINFNVSVADRFMKVDAPHGVFIAIQVSFAPSQDPSNPDRTGANGEAMGAFHDLSKDLVMHENCASTVLSQEHNSTSAFSGTTYFSWTPSFHAWETGVLKTTGNATFSVVWANDPAAAGVQNPYVYFKTLAIADGNVLSRKPIVSTPSKKAEQIKSCKVNSTKIAGHKHAYKASPVFVQALSSGEGQTFAAGRCIVCRTNTACASARITCATEPGVPVIEELWFSSGRCNGPADSKRFAADIVCPGPEHWHVDTLDLERFIPKLRKDFPAYFPSDAIAIETLHEYRKMLALIQAQPSASVVPSKLVDLAWHSHILDTNAYTSDTRRLFGHYLHHAPSFGGAEEKEELTKQQHAMFARYAERFGVSANGSAAWRIPKADRAHGYPEDTVWKAQHSPDCCAAKCVKPACQSCVGCNAIDCGYLADTKSPERAASQLAPERFAGYVPSLAARPFSESELEPVYACSSQPHPKMTLCWSVVDDYIHFKHTLKMDAWYGVGLASPSSANMGPGVDYMVTMKQGGNYTDYVRDMYKWDSGNGYPCWDVLYECSGENKTRGTPDLEDVSVTRANGVTTSTWNRKLITGDHKDYNITDDFVRVLYAYGVEDYYTYHDQNFGECTLNFISGAVQFCWWAGAAGSARTTNYV